MPAPTLQDTLNILHPLTELFKEVFDDSTIQLTEQTTPADIESWDSLSNLRMFMAVEKAFAIRFASHEIGHVQNVGWLIQLILSKRTA
ncbi:MAG: acyl carrier protein [Magnetococcales bacterium]|nr:acyl carrier protein [Magnetococcales bacterium]